MNASFSLIYIKFQKKQKSHDGKKNGEKRGKTNEKI